MSQTRRRIEQIRAELGEMTEPEDLPWMIRNTNVLRLNEYLSEANRKQSELLAAYGEYAGQLESFVSTALEIQMDLKDVLRDQSRLIDDAAGAPRPAKKGAAKAGRQPAGAPRPAKKGAAKAGRQPAGAPRPAKKGAAKAGRQPAGAPRPAKKGAAKAGRQPAGAPRPDKAGRQPAGAPRPAKKGAGKA